MRTMMSMDIISILNDAGIYNAPDWVVWVIYLAAGVSIIVGAIATAGLATIPTSVAWALLGADSIGL